MLRIGDPSGQIAAVCWVVLPPPSVLRLAICVRSGPMLRSGIRPANGVAHHAWSGERKTCWPRFADVIVGWNAGSALLLQPSLKFLGDSATTRNAMCAC